MWAAIKGAISAIAGVVNIANWFTKKRDQADQQEAGAAKQRAADADKTIKATSDAAKADAAMRDPGGKRAKRVRAKYSRD